MSTQESHSVIIIGAGISGLKAAIDLHKAGVDCVILEARDRLGGRLQTMDLDGFPVDLGASWFHDCLTNPLLSKNINNKEITYYFDDAKLATVTSSGVLDHEPIMPVVEEFYKFVQIRLLNNPNALDDSIHNIVNEYIANRKPFLTPEQLKYAPQLVRFMELWYGSSWDQTSYEACGDGGHDGRNAFLTSGYYSVYRNELKEFSLERILTEKVVFKIERSQSEINIFCTDGSKYSAKDIIVTIPQLCLKSKDYSLPGSVQWVPELPTSITSYFPKMSFSALGKVAFKFDKIYWPVESDRFLCIADSDDKSIQHLSATGEPLKFPIVPEEARLQSKPEAWEYPVLFVNVAKFSKKPIVILLIQSPITQYIESLQSEDQVWEYFAPYFQKICSLGVVKPEKILKTNWTQDPFTRGSYTGGQVGCDYEGSIEILIKGLPHVRFAGEHTVIEGNGCAHGAWRSGKREAAYILRKYNKL